MTMTVVIIAMPLSPRATLLSLRNIARVTPVMAGS
jgi:hypothetical protein